jgi:regulator of cell morphogenesis and NO signaling
MKDLMNKSVATIVTKNINTASVFKKYKIDFSFHGNMLLSKACKEQNVNLKQIVKDLKAVNSTIYYLKDYDSWNLDFLIDFIINIHHEYKEENILFLKEYGKKVATIYGDQFKELKEINLLINEVTDNILEHMKNEEKTIFPYIKKLLDAQSKNKTANTTNSPLNDPIESLEDEHEKVGNVFKRISILTNNYTLPKNTCVNYKVLYLKLQQFEEKLFTHIHIENNILFPKAKRLERSFYELQ